MSSDVVIRVEGLSKRYRLGLIGRTALHEDLSRWLARLRGQPDPTMRLDQLQRLEVKNAQESELHNDAEHIWALRDINFEVKQGEVLGIIGKNGAGKSTLLKILSRVTAPTLGCVKVKGRIASLLEIGTGFHPELTGRENIFLNGAILGMSKAETRGKFDEIVAFSGCETYIDTPVKRYSSGMHVRLAFAVAAHLEPEILVVDEVLAVGDAEFQRKCLGKMSEVASRGRTVLFVSHNMGAIQQLCPQSILLCDGALTGGPMPSQEAVNAYLNLSRPSKSNNVNFRRDVFCLESVRLTALDGSAVQFPIPHDEPHCVEITFTLDRYDSSFFIGYELFNQEGQVLYVSMSSDDSLEQCPRIKVGRNRLRSVIPAYFLNEGDYQIGPIAYFQGAICLVNPHKDDVQTPFSVRMGPGVSLNWNRKRLGSLAPLFPWEQIPNAPDGLAVAGKTPETG